MYELSGTPPPPRPRTLFQSYPAVLRGPRRGPLDGRRPAAARRAPDCPHPAEPLQQIFARNEMIEITLARLLTSK